MSVLRGALALLSAQPVTWAASLVTTMFVPRYLSAHDLGQLAIAGTIAGLAGTVLGLGISTSLTRRVAACPERAPAHATGALVLLLGLATPGAVGLAFVGPFLGISEAGDLIVPIALVGMVVFAAQSVLASSLVGQQRHARIAWISASGTVVTAIAGVAYLAGGGSLAGFMLVGVLVSVAVTIVGWRTTGLGLDRTGLDRRLLWQLAREGLPFLGWTLTNRLRGDVVVMLLTAFVSQQAVGWWGAAGRIVAVPLFVPGLITTPLLPALTKCVDDRIVFERTLRQSLILMLILTVPACALVAGIAPSIPGLFGWQAEFERSVPLMRLMSVQIPLVAVGMVLGVAVFALGEERRWLIASALVTALTAGLMLVVVPTFEAWWQRGAAGAAMVPIVTELVMIGSALILLPRGIVDRQTLMIGARVVIAAIVPLATASWLTPVSVILAVAGAGLLYATTLLALGVVGMTDLLAARRTVVQRMARRRAASPA